MPAECCWPGTPEGNYSWTCRADLAGSWWRWGGLGYRCTLICSQSAPVTCSHKHWVHVLWRPATNQTSVGDSQSVFCSLKTIRQRLITSPILLSILMNLTNPHFSSPLSEYRPSRNCSPQSNSSLSKMGERKPPSQKILCYLSLFKMVCSKSGQSLWQGL